MEAVARNSIVGQQRPAPSGDVANKSTAFVIDHINDSEMVRSKQGAEQQAHPWAAMLQRRSTTLTPADAATAVAAV